MNWYWKVRIYNTNGQYGMVEICTTRNLREIDAIQDAYSQLTGSKMLLEGMSERPYGLDNNFHSIWKENSTRSSNAPSVAPTSAALASKPLPKSMQIVAYARGSNGHGRGN